MKKRGIFVCLLSVFLLASCGREKADEFGEEYIPGFDDNRSARKRIDLYDKTLYIEDFIHNIVYCADVESGDLYPLCSKPDCSHRTLECNASVGLAPDLHYHQDKLIASDGVKVWYLRTDGSGREEIGRFKDFEYAGEICASVVHRGYVYSGQTLFKDKEVVTEVMRLSVESGESEAIFKQSWPYDGDGISWGYGVNHCHGIGSRVYFTIDHIDGEEALTGLYCYDTKNGKTARIYEGASQWITCPMNGKWYWQTETGVYCWDPETGEERCLYAFSENPGWREYMEIYQDGFIIREYDPVVLRFYDWEGNFVTSLDFPTTNALHFSVEGNFDQYLVCRYVTEGKENYHFAVLDTGRLGDPTLEWMRFEFED